MKDPSLVMLEVASAKKVADCVGSIVRLLSFFPELPTTWGKEGYLLQSVKKKGGALIVCL